MMHPAFFTLMSRLRRPLSLLALVGLLTACGIKGELYLPPNRLPNAKPPAGSEDAKDKAAQSQPTIPAAALRNPANDSPADIVSDQY